MKCVKTSRLFVLLLVILGTVSGTVSCTDSEAKRQRSSKNDNAKPTVYAVNYPLQYFAERIGGDWIDVKFPAPSGEDPAFWKPTAEIVAEFQKADLILVNGATYAKWIDRTTLPESRIVDTTYAIKDSYIHVKNAIVHSHGPGGDHSHEGIAFTTWLDPMNAIEQARSIELSLQNLLPNKTEELKNNFTTLKTDHEKLHRQLEEITNRKPDVPLVASHPVYQYLKKRYNLNLKSVHWEPEEVPSSDQWKELEKILSGHAAKWMIWEGTPSEKTVAELKSRGLRSIVFSPCGNKPDSDNYLAVMNQNLEAIRKIYER